MKSQRILASVLVVILLTVSGGFVNAEMASTNYEIRFDTIGSGGDQTSTSASYNLRDSIGEIAPDDSSSASYQLGSGFRKGIFDPAVDFAIFIQDRATQVAASSLVGTTVTVTSAAGIAEGDKIVIIQDEGGGQVSAIGEVTATTVITATVDFLTDSGSTPNIDGTDDFVYVLDGGAVSLGVLSDLAVTTATIAWEINLDTDDGYEVFVFEDGDIRDGPESIDDVADGTVTAANSEYGGRSSDSTLASSTFDTEDAAFGMAFSQIASRSDIEFKSRDFLTVKVAIDDDQPEGNYSHTLTFVYVGDY